MALAWSAPFKAPCAGALSATSGASSASASERQVLPVSGSAAQWRHQASVLGLASTACALASGTNRSSARRQQRQVRVAANASGDGKVGFVLLAAGKGKRMGASIPKQYLKLAGLEIALHSFDTALDSGLYEEICVVLDDEYKSLFEGHLKGREASLSKVPKLKFANGGKERQDSVCNGLANITCEFVALHDSARPLVTIAEMEAVIKDAKKTGAALLGVPTKATIKQANMSGDKLVVDNTPDRSTLFEAHTPQVMRAELLRKGFDFVNEKKLEVTDDASIAEALGEEVTLTVGEYTNLKVTTPEDLVIAEAIIAERKAS
mmetsp:Transcript_29449/g.67838  ORF Transcript_29449/g.67838 Transcript_29449/m.67838 type:complete len:320 (+) Transcript_29449:61-1020(+)